MYDLDKKRLPIGIESFEEIRTDEYYYVDKTAFIRDLLRRRGKVNLFTRPRRFGKTLNMDMLKSFFRSAATRRYLKGWILRGRSSYASGIWANFRSSPLA